MKIKSDTMLASTSFGVNIFLEWNDSLKNVISNKIGGIVNEQLTYDEVPVHALAPNIEKQIGEGQLIGKTSKMSLDNMLQLNANTNHWTIFTQGSVRLKY